VVVSLPCGKKPNAHSLPSLLRIALINMKQWFSKAFNLAILQKNRMPWVDYLRGIAILLVVYRHVLVGLQRSNFTIPVGLINANMIFFSFRMPLFFILSGMFINSSIIKRSLKQLAFIKFENLLYPYLVWAFIQITLQILLSRFTNSDRGLKDYLLIFYEPRGLDQFWYLPALFNTTMIYILVKVKLKATSWVQLLLGAALYLTSPYIRGLSMVSDWMEFYIFFAVGDALSSFFFKKKSQDFLKKYSTFLLVIPLFTIAQFYYLSHSTVYYSDDHMGKLAYLPIVFIGCFSMFVLAFRLQNWNILKFLRVLGFHSLFIYVMHVIISAFTRIVLIHLFGINNPYLLLIGGIATGVTIPVIIYNLLIKDNVGRFLFSLSKHPKKTE
jgi:fucose 4-O-acetylase-like acetyltransferase